MTTEEIKGALLDSFWGIDRGLTASAETRADINELITQLEAQSPCQNPTEVRSLIAASLSHVCRSSCFAVSLLVVYYRITGWVLRSSFTQTSCSAQQFAQGFRSLYPSLAPEKE